jgi:hypothetical protein
MKKLISVLSVVLVLVFSCVLTSFAEGTSILTLENLSDSRLSVSGNSSVVNGRVTVPAGGIFSAFIRVKPVSATRKYKFSFYHECTSPVGSSFSLSGSLRIYYKDSSSNSELNTLHRSIRILRDKINLLNTNYKHFHFLTTLKIFIAISYNLHYNGKYKNVNSIMQSSYKCTKCKRFICTI